MSENEKNFFEGMSYGKASAASLQGIGRKASGGKIGRKQLQGIGRKQLQGGATAARHRGNYPRYCF